MSDTDEYKKHAIQLKLVKVLELSINILVENQQEEMPDSGSFSLFHGYSDYNHESKEIAVRIGVEIDKDNTDAPFSLRIELIGVFSVDDENFPMEHIHSWAKKNAPLILYPYLREHTYSLTLKAGFDGVLLPLLEVPTFRIKK